MAVQMRAQTMRSPIIPDSVPGASRKMSSSALHAALGFAVVACMTHAPGIAAQPYPARPVRLVVPFPPGGSNDIVARVVGASLGERIGKQIIIDNRAGGNSII